MSGLTQKVGFGHVLSANKVKGCSTWGCFFAINRCTAGRLGIIVKKRDFPKAVERNKIKRIVREKFRLHPIREVGLDVVVIVKAGLLADNQAKEKLLAIFNEIKSRCAGL